MLPVDPLTLLLHLSQSLRVLPRLLELLQFQWVLLTLSLPVFQADPVYQLVLLNQELPEGLVVQRVL